MNGLILTTCVIVAGTTELSRSVSQSGKLEWNPSLRPVIGAFVVGMLLLLLDEGAPNLTSKFCALIIVAALLINGRQAITYLSDLTNAKV